MVRSKPERVPKQLTISQLEEMYPDDDACQAFLAAKRWPDGVKYPRCGDEGVYADFSYKPYHWQCHNCAPSGYRFSVLVRTTFENTTTPLKTWFRVIYIILTSKIG